MPVSNFVIRDCHSQESNVLVDFVESPLQHSLFLNEAVQKKEVKRVKTTNATSQFLDECLRDALLGVSKYKAVFMRDRFRRRDLLF